MQSALIRRLLLAAAPAMILSIGLAGMSLANPLGIGVGETALPQPGFFGKLLGWIQASQQEFYRALTGALRAMRDGEGGTWLLAGLSFAYGVFHAAGPGHGKAVISSYMLANEVALRRGVALAFLSSLLQGLVAIAIVGAAFLFLRGTSISMRSATHAMEIASYALVTLFGAWLLWRKLRALGLRRKPASLSAAHAGHGHHAQDGNHAHEHMHAHDHGGCAACGHSHAPDPRLLSGERMDLTSAWTAIAAVGMRPCSGALIVLTFAFLNGLWAGGLFSVLAMSIGTALTVSILATLAVTAKNVALRFSGSRAFAVHDAIEIGGALMILLLGLLLLAASV